jgi:hypothetical protein
LRNEEKNEEARELEFELLVETELLLNWAGRGRAIGVLVGFTLFLLITGIGCAPVCPQVF